MLVIEIIAVLALFVLNGFFAMAELAIVSSRRTRLERLAKEGRPGAQVALQLPVLRSPNGISSVPTIFMPHL